MNDFRYPEVGVESELRIGIVGLFDLVERGRQIRSRGTSVVVGQLDDFTPSVVVGAGQDVGVEALRAVCDPEIKSRTATMMNMQRRRLNEQVTCAASHGVYLSGREPVRRKWARC